MVEYHPNFPPACPPSDALPASGEIFRGIRTPPVTSADFLSHVELQMKNCDSSNCEHWGLSVWVSRAAVVNARKVFKYMRRWHIAVGTVDADDGVIKPTPNEKNNEHHTFWKAFGNDISDRFTIAFEPEVSS